MKPYIICHMMASVDGRIDCAMTEQIDSSNTYYEALEQLDCPTTIEGRVTADALRPARTIRCRIIRAYRIHSLPQSGRGQARL